MPVQFSRIAGSIAVANKINTQLLNKWGLDMVMVYYATGDETHFRAFLQPLRYKNKLYLSHKPTELSYDTLQKYLLVAAPEAPLDKIDGYTYKLYHGEKLFKVDHCEWVYFNGEPYYYWAVVSREA